MATTSKDRSHQMDMDGLALIADDVVADQIFVNGNQITGTELGFIDGVTAGTAAASKAVVLGASKEIATITTATITNLTSSAINLGSGSLTRSNRQIIIPVSGNAKVGATAGWVITGGTNIGHATLPASQTNSTLVIPITGLAIGDQVTAVAVVGQVESGGNNVTLTMDVRKLSAAVATDLTDASLGTDNVGTLTADTLLTDANGNLKTTGLTETLDATESLYVLLTGTTAASTDIDIMSLVVTVTQA